MSDSFERMRDEIMGATAELRRYAAIVQRSREAHDIEMAQLWESIAELRDDLLTTRNLIGKVKDAA